MQIDNQGRRGLVRFLAGAEITQAQFARIANVTAMQVCHLVAGRRLPSLRLAAAIERATQGTVPARAWTEPT